ncbi:hypothetical protein [Mumia zhuanghuii]|uniref:hypothetical protein n=1 Tax=Mumia zhuanghuii TaxID=2585211 RepID=UPI00129D10C5|nr:hypothetical protein [Mumia zhuanghuii]
MEKLWRPFAMDLPERPEKQQVHPVPALLDRLRRRFVRALDSKYGDTSMRVGGR